MKNLFFLALAVSFTFAMPAFAAVPQKSPEFKISKSKLFPVDGILVGAVSVCAFI